MWRANNIRVWSRLVSASRQSISSNGKRKVIGPVKCLHATRTAIYLPLTLLLYTSLSSFVLPEKFSDQSPRLDFSVSIFVCICTDSCGGECNRLPLIHNRELNKIKFEEHVKE